MAATKKKTASRRKKPPRRRRSPGGQGAKLDTRHLRQHAKLIERAIRERWVVPEDVRQRLIPEVWETLQGARDPRAIAALAKVIVAADVANLQSEKRDDRKPPAINVNIINQIATELSDKMTVEQLRTMYLEIRKAISVQPEVTGNANQVQGQPEPAPAPSV